MEDRIIVLGGIGNNERQNRDNKRVLGRGGYSITLKSHIATEPPLVIRKYKNEKDSSDRMHGQHT